MNKEELRQLTESYYRDVYDYETIDEVKGFGGRVDPHTGEWVGRTWTTRSPAQRAFATYSDNPRHPWHSENPDDPRRSRFVKDEPMRNPREGGKWTRGGNTTMDARGAHDEPPGLAMSPIARMTSRAESLSKRPDLKSRQNANKIFGVLNRPDMKKPEIDESYDLYDTVLEHLITEGYADDVRAAQVIMTHMSDEWLGDIMEAALNEIHSDALGLIDPHRGTTTRNAHEPKKVMGRSPVSKMEDKRDRLEGLRDLRKPKESQLSPNNQRRLRNINTALRGAENLGRLRFAGKVEGIKQATKP